MRISLVLLRCDRNRKKFSRFKPPPLIHDFDGNASFPRADFHGDALHILRGYLLQCTILVKKILIRQKRFQIVSNLFTEISGATSTTATASSFWLADRLARPLLR